MLHNEVAQQRPGEKPASAPKTFLSLFRDRNRETRYIIHIHGRHSPPTRLQLTTPATTPQSPTKFLHHKPMLLPQPARNHSFGKGHVHACSVLGPELGTEQQQFYAWHGTPSKSAAKVIQSQQPALPPEAWPCDATQTRPNSQREIRSS